MVSPRGSTKDYKRNWHREVYHAQFLDEVAACLKGPHGEVKAERGTWLVGIMDGMVCGSQVKVELVNSIQKEWCLISPTVVLSKGHTRRRPYEVGDTVYHKDC